MADQTQAPLARMNVYDDLVLLADVIGSLKASGILTLGPDGHYAITNPSTGAIVGEAAAVQGILAQHGLTLPAKAQKFVALLPTVLSFLN